MKPVRVILSEEANKQYEELNSLIPVLYIEKYGVDNLWILDFLDHETYDKVFGYKKK